MWYLSFLELNLVTFIKQKDQAFTDDSFSVVTDFYHFQNGESTEEYWAPM